MDAQAAEGEILASTRTLREFFPVTSFRAPNLKLPPAYLAILERHGYLLDSSAGRHKALGVHVCRVGAITRVPASVTSSTLRWPARLATHCSPAFANPPCSSSTRGSSWT